MLRGDRLGTGRRSLGAALLERLPYDRLLADLDPYRLHALEMLRAVPAGRSVALGLVGTGPTSRLPSYNQLMRYIEAVTSVVRGRLAIATTSAAACEGGRAAPSRLAEQRALRLVGRIARAVWPTSWAL